MSVLLLGGWVVQSSTADGSILYGISCPSRSVCIAVGNDAAGRTVLERSTDGGTTWMSMKSAAAGLVLTRVSCGDVRHCVATGWKTNDALYTADSGAHWHHVALPTPGHGLPGVSCSDALHCFVVENWNHVDMTANGGATWTASPALSIPVPAGQFETGVNFGTITCIAVRECLALGTEDAFANNPQPFPAPPLLFYRYGILAVTTDGGASWHTQAAPEPILSIACTSRTDCIAVYGVGRDYRLTSNDNGNTWTAAPITIADTNTQLFAITCADRLHCVAVGRPELGVPNPATVATIFTTSDAGRTWDPQRPAPGGVDLEGVSCTDSSHCWVVGARLRPNPPSHGSAAAGAIVLQMFPPGYLMVSATGTVYAFGHAQNYGDAHTNAVAHIEPNPSRTGYWIVNRAGQVFPFGDVRSYGNAPPLPAGETVSSLSSTSSGHGYWLFTTRGRVLHFGDAPFYGDMSRDRLNGPIVGSTATPTGHGYFMVGSDGGVFGFGDAHFYGSMAAKRLNRPVIGLVTTADNRGYWLDASDGGIFGFGDATFRGSLGDTPLNEPIIGMVRYGNGYLMVASDGGIFAYSDQPFYGSLGNRILRAPVVGVAS